MTNTSTCIIHCSCTLYILSVQYNVLVYININIFHSFKKKEDQHYSVSVPVVKLTVYVSA